ncbi:MAG TPA: IPT/TIG domain-containing protein, partial [Jatrophihabitans sp.]|nr:IPT/TIG domain-containing protein [Jatrophihabitans sp.]
MHAPSFRKSRRGIAAIAAISLVTAVSVAITNETAHASTAGSPDMTRVAVVDQDSTLALDADGGRLAYTNLDDNGHHQALRFDAATGSSTLLTTASGTGADGDTTAVAINRDGSYVAFTSDATDLDAGGAALVSGTAQAYLAHFTGSGVTLTRLPLPSGGSAGDVAISADGSLVAYGDGDHVQLWHPGAQLTSVDVTPAGATNAVTHHVTLSADGSTLAAVVDDGTGTGRLVVADLGGATATLPDEVDLRGPAALTSGGGTVIVAPAAADHLLSWNWRSTDPAAIIARAGHTISGYPSVSADGAFVADSQKFDDEDGYLARVGVGGVDDVYVSVDDSNYPTPTTGFGSNPTLAESRPELSANGLSVAFRSNAQLAGQPGPAPAGQTVLYIARLHDEQAPTVGGFRADLSVDDLQTTSATLHIPQANDDLGVVAMKLTDNGTPVPGTITANESFTVHGLAPGTKHVFAVTAFDESGHASDPETITAWTPTDPVTGSFATNEVSNLPAGASGIGMQVDDQASSAAISGDGRYVAFVGAPIASYDANGDPLDAAGGDLSDATVQTADDQVYLADTLAGTTTLVTHQTGGTDPATSPAPRSLAFSADGRYLAYDATGIDLAAGAPDATRHVYVYDRTSGTATYVSTNQTPYTSGQALYLNDDGSRLLALTKGSGFLNAHASVIDWQSGGNAPWQLDGYVNFSGAAISGDGNTIAVAGGNGDLSSVSILDVTTQTELASFAPGGTPAGFSTDGSLLRLDVGGDSGGLSAEWDAARPSTLTYFGGGEVVSAAADGMHAGLDEQDNATGQAYVAIAAFPDGAPQRVDNGWAAVVNTDGSALAYLNEIADGSGNFHVGAFVARPDDASAPTWPTGAALTTSDETTSSIHLSWPAASDDNGVASYVLTQDGNPLATLNGNTTDYDVTGLTADTSYTFAVSAKDAVGNASPTLTATAATLGSSVTPGSDPLIAHPQSGGLVSLSWDADADADATATGGYRVLRDEGTGFTPVTDLPTGTTSFTDTGRLAATSYTYRVDALDDTGTASPWTKTASVTTPAITILKTTAAPPLLTGTSLAALGGPFDLRVIGEPNRLASAHIDYWTHTDAGSTPETHTAVVSLTQDPAHLGTYTGSWTIPEGTEKVSAVTGVLSDGVAAHDASVAAAGLPIDVSGAVRVIVDEPDSGTLTGSDLSIDGPGYSTDIAVDDAGTFVAPVPEGTGYHLVLRSETFARLAATSADVTAGLTSTAELAPQFRSSLVVTVDKGDGTSGGTTVTVKDQQGHQLGKQDIAAGQSSVTFNGLSTGDDLTVTSSIDDRTEQVVADDSAQLTLVGGENDVTLTHDALPTNSITGTVTSLRDSLALEGAAVHANVLADGRTWNFDTTTDANGNYQLPVLAGSATVTVSDAGFFDDTAHFSVAAGTPAAHDVQLDPFASVTVHVLPPAGGAGAEVSVALRESFGATVTQIIPAGQTDTSFTGLHHGFAAELTVTVTDHSNVLQRTYSQTFDLDEYENSATVQLVELPSGTLTGTVTTDDGSGTAAPASKATVEISDDADGYFWDTTTDDQGHYSALVLAGVPLSVRILYQANQGWHPNADTATVTVPAAGIATHDVTFSRATVTVHVLPANGVAPGGVTVQVFNVFSSQSQDIPDGQTDATFSNLWWDSYALVRVHVNDDSLGVLPDYETTVHLDGAHNEVTIGEKVRPPGPGLTSGTVGTSADGLPVLNWQRAVGLSASGDCGNGVATTSIVGQVPGGTGDFGNWAYHTYFLNGGGSSGYTGTLPAQYPMHGPVNITSSVGCPPDQAMTPTQGTAGTTVRAMGSDLDGVTGVEFGGVAGTNFAAFDGGLLQVDAPAGSGTVPVVAETANGPVTLGSFTYNPSNETTATPLTRPQAMRAALASANSVSLSTILNFLYSHGQDLLSKYNSINDLHTNINNAINALHPTCATDEATAESIVSAALGPAIDALVDLITPEAEELVLATLLETGPVVLIVLALTPVALKFIIDKLAGAIVHAAVQALFDALGCHDPKPNALIDPSGTVFDTNGNPVAGATVTILRADASDGPFAPVDVTQPGIEPATDPEVTADDGVFHWDVRAGYYEVTASKPGCTVPGDPSQATAITGPYPVPPPQVGLVVTLQCPDEAPPPTPAVTGLSLSHGPTAGGTQVQITGSGFTPSATVTFGNTDAQATFASSNALTVTAPAGHGLVDVVVHTNGGDSATSTADQFFFGDPPTVTGLSATRGPASGGTKLTITGTGFTGATAVGFGGAPGTDLAVVSDTELDVTTPLQMPGTMPVVVVTPAGASTGDAAGQFTFVDRQQVQLAVGTAPSAPVYGQDVTLTVGTSPARPGAMLTATENGST